jgi:hypothetical protein
MLQIMIEFGIQNFKQVPCTHLGSKEHDPVKVRSKCRWVAVQIPRKCVQVRVGCHASACGMPHSCRYGKCPTLCPLCGGYQGFSPGKREHFPYISSLTGGQVPRSSNRRSCHSNGRPVTVAQRLVVIAPLESVCAPLASCRFTY